MSAATASARTTPRPRTTAFAAVGFGLALLVVFAGNYHVSKGENGGTGPAISTAVVCAVLTAVLFGLLVPRTRRPARASLVLGIVSVASLVVFWSGLTPVLAAATLAVATQATERSRTAKTPQVLAVAAALLAIGWTLANSHLF
jgi:amino acid permease